jgi:hypothetical protein
MPEDTMSPPGMEWQMLVALGFLMPLVGSWVNTVFVATVVGRLGCLWTLGAGDCGTLRLLLRTE